MLDTYKKLEANGVIGKMMKVDRSGREIIDPSGETPGNLVVRPFVEFPKVVRRFKHELDASGKPVTRTIETIAHSKSEELRILAENPDTMDIPLSPLERERDALAQENAAQTKTIGAMQEQMAAMMQQMAELAAKVDQGAAEKIALGKGETPQVHEAPAPSPGKGLEALALGKKS